ncbi:hypothetical protein [Streptomyces sp. ODS28]|uniref:hypothetical protein n=1 Tax=Streptomyces sp. ODS28 TaxID=3136688 RepID=UPI0031EDE029
MRDRFSSARQPGALGHHSGVVAAYGLLASLLLCSRPAAWASPPSVPAQEAAIGQLPADGQGDASTTYPGARADDDHHDGTPRTSTSDERTSARQETDRQADREAEAGQEDAAAAFLRAQGLDAAQWRVTGVRATQWTRPDGSLGTSTRYTITRTPPPAAVPGLEELLAAVRTRPPRPERAAPQGDHSFVVALGDMHFGTCDGDAAEGTARRTLACLDAAADRLAAYRQRFAIGHVHLAWLGDHIEGFVAQGGAQAWRTPLPLTEQIRLTRHVMLHAALTFAPLAPRVTLAAVPGNHGQAVRVSGRGPTRFDDNHDTEALVAVHEALALDAEAFGHVTVHVPASDELTVVVECSGTVVAHAHGHQWPAGQHFAWWRGQAFNASSPLQRADVLLAGHRHREFTDTEGPRTFIQPPALRAESTWHRHRHGTAGAPGLLVLVTKDGQVPVKEVVR